MNQNCPSDLCAMQCKSKSYPDCPVVALKGLKSPKRFTNLPLDSSRCPGEKREIMYEKKKKVGIQ